MDDPEAEARAPKRGVIDLLSFLKYGVHLYRTRSRSRPLSNENAAQRGCDNLRLAIYSNEGLRGLMYKGDKCTDLARLSQKYLSAGLTELYTPQCLSSRRSCCLVSSEPSRVLNEMCVLVQRPISISNSKAGVDQSLLLCRRASEHAVAFRRLRQYSHGIEVVMVL